MDNPIAVEPQPRIDTLTTDAASGIQLRRTEYSGTAWFGGKPQLTGYGTITMAQGARVQTPFYLPDSLPYRSGIQAILAMSVAVQSAPDEAHQVLEYKAELAPDPRDPAVAWVQLHVLAAIRTPTGLSYRVTVLVQPGGVLPQAAGS